VYYNGNTIITQTGVSLPSFNVNYLTMGGQSGLAAYINEFVFYNRTLSDADISSNYNSYSVFKNGYFAIPYASGGTYKLTQPVSNYMGSISYTSGNTTVATILGSTIYIGNVGNTVITATQTASGNFAGYTISANLQITPGSATFVGSSITVDFSNGGTYTIPTPSSISKGTFSYSLYGSYAPYIATITGNVINIGNALPQSCTLLRTQSASGNYGPYTHYSTLLVNSMTPTITFNISSQIIYTSGGTYEIPQPISNSPMSFTYTSGTTAVATISGSTINLISKGSTIITATQAQGGGYAGRNYASKSVTATVQLI